MAVGMLGGAYKCAIAVTDYMSPGDFRKFVVGLVFMGIGVVLGMLYIVLLHWKADTQIRALGPENLQKLTNQLRDERARAARAEAEVANVKKYWRPPSDA